MVTTLPSRTTPAELRQVQNLIFKGKEFATRGDPKLQRIVQFLRERGFQSASEVVASREARLAQERQTAEPSGRDLLELEKEKRQAITQRQSGRDLLELEKERLARSSSGRDLLELEKERLARQKLTRQIPDIEKPTGRTIEDVRREIIRDADKRRRFTTTEVIEGVSKATGVIFSPFLPGRDFEKRIFERAVREGLKTGDPYWLKNAINQGFTDFETAKAAGYIGRDVEAEREQVKKDFPPAKVFEFAAEATVRGGEILGGGEIAPGPRKITKQIIEDLFMISTFSPLIQTGTAQQTTQEAKVAQKVAQKKKLTKKDLRDLLEAPKKEGNVVKIIGKGTGDYQIKAERARALLNAAKGPEGRAEAIKLIKESFGDDFLKEFIAQGELGFLPGVSGGMPATTTGPSVTIEVPQLAKIPAVPQTTFGTSLLDPSKVGETNFISGTGIFTDTFTRQATRQVSAQATVQLFGTSQDSKQSLAQGLGLATKQTTAQQTKQATRQVSAQSLAQGLGLATKQTTAQQTKQATRQVSAQATVQLLNFDTKQTTKQTQRQTQGFGQPSQIPSKPVPKKPKPIPGLSGGLVQRLAKKAEKGVLGYFAEVKELGKWKKVNPNKPVSKKRAEKLAKKVADRTISASSRVTKSKKNAMDFFRSIAVDDSKFRDFKIRAGKKIPQKDLWIEKRKHRLDTKSETQTLQAFKRSAEFKGLIGKPRPQPRKKAQEKRMAYKDKKGLGSNIFFKF